MTEDQYVLSIISKYKLPIGDSQIFSNSSVSSVCNVIREWSGNYLNSIKLSGSRAKGTAIKLGADLDLFISLNSSISANLRDIYNSLYNYFDDYNFKIKKQNVSIGLDYNNIEIDLVPGKNHTGNTNNHSLYISKRDSWTLTNIEKHINLVKNSGRINEIVAMKIWRDINGIDFPSIYLELIVIEALKNKNTNQPSSNILDVLKYLRDNFVNKRIEDPANTNNIISNDLTKLEKEKIATKAEKDLKKQYWEKIIW